MLGAMGIRQPKWLIIAALITMAPDAPGAFELWENGELVFIGSTSNTTLRSQLARELLDTGRDASQIDWEITYRPAAREGELLEEFERAYHRRPRLNPAG